MEDKMKNETFKLHSAASRGHIDECRRLIKEGVVIDNFDFVEWTPLMCAARFGHRDTVELLHLNGASCNAINAYGYSPLCMAVASNDEGTFKYILQALLVHSKEELKKETVAYELACLQGRTKLLKLLLSFDVFDINKTSIPGMTPLLLSAYGGNVETGKLLLELGADKFATNLMNQTAFDISLYRKDTKMQALFSGNSSLRTVPLPITPVSPSNDHVFIFPPTPYICEPDKQHLPILFNSVTHHPIPLEERKLSRLESNDYLHLKNHNNTVFGQIQNSSSSAFPQIENKSCQNCYLMKSLISPRFFYSPEEKLKKQIMTTPIKETNSKDARNNNKYGYISWIKEKISRRRCKSVEEVYEEDKSVNIFLFDETRIKNNVTITKLLTGLKLEEYISLFIRNELDANTILTLTERDLMVMGIGNKEERKAILRKIGNFELQN